MKKEYFEVLLESIDSKFQLTMEAFSTLDSKIDRFRDELTEKIDIVDCKVMGLSKRVASVDERLSGVETRLDTLTTEFAAHRDNTEFHRVPRKQALKKAA